MRKMPKELSETAADVIELMGKRKSTGNILARKLPEIRDIPHTMKLTLFGRGSLLGEEDVLSRPSYTCTLRCHSFSGTLYSVKRQDFMVLRTQDDSWLAIIEKVIEKEKRRRGEWLDEGKVEKYQRRVS